MTQPTPRPLSGSLVFGLAGAIAFVLAAFSVGPTDTLGFAFFGMAALSMAVGLQD